MQRARRVIPRTGSLGIGSWILLLVLKVLLNVVEQTLCSLLNRTARSSSPVKLAVVGSFDFVVLTTEFLQRCELCIGKDLVERFLLHLCLEFSHDFLQFLLNLTLVWR